MLKNHEAFVHFPLALFLTAFLFGCIGLFYKRFLFREVIFWNLLVGVTTLALAIYSGFLSGEAVTDQRLQEVLDLHQRSAYMMGGLFFVLTVWLGWRKKRMRLREYLAWFSLLFIASVSAGYQGYMGHEMAAQIKEIEIQEARTPVQSKPLDYGWNF